MRSEERLHSLLAVNLGMAGGKDAEKYQALLKDTTAPI